MEIDRDATNHTVPYGTGPLLDRLLAINCQATIVLSLRDDDEDEYERKNSSITPMPLRPCNRTEINLWAELNGVRLGRRIGRESIPVSMVDCASWRWDNWTVKAGTDCS